MMNFYDFAANNGLDGLCIESVKHLGDYTPEIKVQIAEMFDVIGRLVDVGIQHLDETDLDGKINLEFIDYVVGSLKDLSNGIFRYEAMQLVSDK